MKKKTIGRCFSRAIWPAKLKESCYDKDDSFPVGAGRGGFSGQRRGFAQSGGEATYKAKCQMCHGATGIPSRGDGQDDGHQAGLRPAIKKLTVAEMIAAVKNGKGKMKPVAGLTDAQIKDVVTFYSGLK